MLALMTTTAYEQKKVIEAIKEPGLRDRVKIAVGGAVVTQECAEMIGADGYDPTAIMGVTLLNRLLGA